MLLTFPYQDIATQLLWTVLSFMVMFLQYNSSLCIPKPLQSTIWGSELGAVELLT